MRLCFQAAYIAYIAYIAHIAYIAYIGFSTIRKYSTTVAQKAG